jgi:hypothetical protein
MRVTTASQLDWLALFDALGVDGQAAYFFLLNLAGNRSSFEMRVTDMIPRISNISIARFNELLSRLVRFELLRIRQKKNGVAAWDILKRPTNWKPSDMSHGRKFCIHPRIVSPRKSHPH